MKTSKYNLLTLSIFLISPGLSLLGAFRSMLRGERFGYFLLSIFFGLLGYLMIPYDTMDITRHYADYKLIAQMSLSEVLTKDPARMFLYLLMWGVRNIGLPKEIIPFLFVSVTYYLPFSIILYILKDYPRKKKSLTTVSFIIIFSFIILNELRFVAIASGLRNNLAFSMSLLSIYLILSRKQKGLGVFLMVLSCIIHPSTILIAIVFMVSRVKQLHKPARFLFFIGIIIIITDASSFLFFSVMDYLKPLLIMLDAFHPSYFSRNGSWGGGFWETANFKTILLEKYIKPMPIYIAAIYLILVRSSVPDFRRLLYLLFFLVSIISISRTLFDRYAYFITLLFIVVMMIEYRLKEINRIRKVFIFVFMISLIAMDSAGLYKYRDIYSISWKKVLYTPVPFLLMESVEPEEYLIRGSK